MQSIDPGAILLNRPRSPILNRGLERINERSPAAIDILHRHATSEPAWKNYTWIVELNEIAAPAAPPTRNSALAADTWNVKADGDRPARVRIEAGSERAQLFALYHIAECLAAGRPPADWTIRRRPRVPKRYAWPSAGNVWSPVFRPDQFRSTLDALPGLGISGILLTFSPTHGTHYGRETIPFALTEDGVRVDRQKLPAFKTLMEELKSYGLDIHLFHQAFIPPPFTSEAVRAHYAGERELPGFTEAVETSSHALATTLFRNLPQVDGLLHHSIECNWIWGEAVSIFPCQDDRAAADAFSAYLRGMSRACREHGKDLMYWTHVSGVSARQIRLQHDVLEAFPDIMVVEDHAWPNNMWPFAPAMGHLSADLRNKVVKGRFGLSIDTVDGEYYGAGALPTAYPDPHIRCGRAAAELGAELSFVRMNEQSLTPLGTLDDINAIHVIGTVEQWWENPRPADRLWSDWCARRFGPAAAPTIVSALQKSKAIITQGFSAAGIPLMDHSGLATHNWQPGNETGAWAVFAHPESVLVDKPYDELVGNEFRAWQVNARGVRIEDFLRDSSAAEAAAHQALREVESVGPNLSREDAAYLARCFEDAIPMIKAIRRTAVAAHAHASFERSGSKADRKALESACNAMENLADDIQQEQGENFRPVHWFMKARYQGKDVAGYGVPIALRVIADSYREALDCDDHLKTALAANGRTGQKTVETDRGERW